jgi:hypothetical protein
VTDFDPYEVNRLAEQAETWFRLATNKFKTPNRDCCEQIATYLWLLKNNPGKKSNRQTLTTRYGKRFLYHLKWERDNLAHFISLLSKPRVRLRRDVQVTNFQRLLDQIEETIQTIEVLLPHFEKKRDPKHDVIRDLAGRAAEAWKSENDGKAPSVHSGSGPMCRFLHPALIEIGENLTKAAIGAVLRGRRR